MIKHRNEFKDVLGRDITIGDYVSTVYQNMLIIASVVKLAPKMLSLKKFNTEIKFNKYSDEVTLLTPKEEVIEYILRNSK
jgi:hypothetical protein